MRMKDRLNRNVTILCIPMPHFLLSLYSDLLSSKELTCRMRIFICCFSASDRAKLFYTHHTSMAFFQYESSYVCSGWKGTRNASHNPKPGKHKHLPYRATVCEVAGQMPSCMISRSPVRHTCRRDSSTEIHQIFF
jgi:hypothetical protein